MSIYGRLLFLEANLKLAALTVPGTSAKSSSPTSSTIRGLLSELAGRFDALELVTPDGNHQSLYGKEHRPIEYTAGEQEFLRSGHSVLSTIPCDMPDLCIFLSTVLDVDSPGDGILVGEIRPSYLWDAELRPGNAGTWEGCLEVLNTTFANVPPQIRELRVRADAGFGFDPVFAKLEEHRAQYAVTARLSSALKRLLPGLSYQFVNRDWEMSEFEHRLHGWPHARRFVVARRFVQKEEAETTLFSMGRYIYRAWVTNMSLTPAGIWHFYDGRAGMEPRIGELREDFALRKIPTA